MDRERTRESKLRVDSVIGQNVRVEREMRRMTRDELAEVMDLTVSHMGLIERGERGATAVTLEKLARVFNVPVDNFFAEPDGRPLAVRDGGSRDKYLNTNRQKISSLIARLDEHETDFIIHTIKGIVNLKHSRDILDDLEYDEFDTDSDISSDTETDAESDI